MSRIILILLTLVSVPGSSIDASKSKNNADISANEFARANTKVSVFGDAIEIRYIDTVRKRELVDYIRISDISVVQLLGADSAYISIKVKCQDKSTSYSYPFEIDDWDKARKVLNDIVKIVFKGQ